ncbi:MAG: response regulator transcription factor [Actinomycetota bacterium]|nr:response regulator transcription factor [Actinomycetota bacterium]
MTISVVITDDQAMVRAGFRSLLAEEPGIAVVAEAVDGQDALAAVRRHAPDVVLMDIRMPVMDGIAATRQLVAEGSRSRVLVVTTFDLDEYVFDALRAGASGFLLKDSTAEELVSAIRTVAAGEALLDPTVTRRVVDAFTSTRPPQRTPSSELSRLTTREVQVLRLMAKGLSNAEIAGELVVSDATAKTHVSNVLSKLGLRDRVQGVVYAYENGIVEPGEDLR